MEYKNVLFSHSADTNKLNININEVYRYMGTRGKNATDAEKKLVSEHVDETLASLTLRGVYMITDADVSAESVKAADTDFKSRLLAKNMKGCSYACLFVITCGQGADRVISKYSRCSPSSALAVSAISTAAVEAYADMLCRDIEKLISADGLRMRPRFSPGYGDLSIKYQTDIIRVTDSSRRIGVTLTDDLMMLPTKSVSAIIGLSDYDSGCIPSGCESCKKTDCLFRINVSEDEV